MVDACLYKKKSAELSSGKWNKRSASYHIIPQPLDKTCQRETDNHTGQSTLLTHAYILLSVYGLF